MNFPSRVTICECAARDGIQHEVAFVSTHDKVSLIDQFSDAGFKRIEATSFSHPSRVPQFKDAEEVLRLIHRLPGVHYKGTCVNAKAVGRAVAALRDGHGPTEISVVVSASEAHSLVNIGKTHAEVRADLDGIIELAFNGGLRVVGTIATAFGCPFVGAIGLEGVMQWVQFFTERNVGQICLADTTGMGDPLLVERRCAEIRDRFPDLRLIAHFHDTRGRALANVVAALRVGVDHFDSAFGGLGGNPPGIEYSRGETGNVATEDLVAMLTDMGIDTGLELDRLVELAHLVERTIGRQLHGRVARAGLTGDLLPRPVQDGS
jgi:hydroxymethylglutaryl-CoA lyase